MRFPSLVVVNIIRIYVRMNKNNKKYTFVDYLIIMAEMKPHFAKVVYLYCMYKDLYIFSSMNLFSRFQFSWKCIFIPFVGHYKPKNDHSV